MKSKRRLSTSLFLIDLPIFSVATIIMTWPVISRLGRGIPGYGDDAYMFVWNLWWFKTAVVNSWNPYFCDLIHYPLGASLVFHTFSPVNCLLALPLLALGGLKTSYSTLFLLTFLLSALATSWLFRQVIGSGCAGAIVAGFIFGFAPFRAAHGLGHLNLLSTQWIPLYVGFLLKTRNSRQLRDIVLAASCLLITSFSCLNYMALLFVATLIVVMHGLIIDPRRGFLAVPALMVMLVIFALGFSPILQSAVTELALHGNYLDARNEDSERWSADLLSFLTPSVLNSLFQPSPTELDKGNEDYPPNWTVYLTKGVRLLGTTQRFRGHPHEWTVYLGILALLLAGVGLASRWQNRSLFAASFIIFWVLSLGPTLMIGGRSTGIPMPYRYLQTLPVIGEVRMPARFTVMTMLALAILAGAGLNRLISAWRIWPKRALTTAVLTALSLEFWSVPYPMDELPEPQLYATLAQRSGTLLDLPLGWRTGLRVDPYERTIFQYYQTLHERPTLGGHVSRFPPRTREYYLHDPGLSALFHLAQQPLDFGLSPETLSATFDFLAIDAIIVHRYAHFHAVRMRLLSDEAVTRYTKAIMDSGLMRLSAADEDRLAFERVVDPRSYRGLRLRPDDPGAIFLFGQGWSRIHKGELPFVAAEGPCATIVIPEQEPALAEATLSLRPFHWDGLIPYSVPLLIELDDSPVATVVLEEELQNVTIDLTKLPIRGPTRSRRLSIRNLDFNWGRIGTSSIASPIQLTARCYPSQEGYLYQALIGGSLIPAQGQRGLMILALDPRTGKVVLTEQIANPGEPETVAVTRLNELKPGFIVLAAYAGNLDKCSEALTAFLVNAGADSANLAEAYRAFIVIGIVGSERGTALWQSLKEADERGVICHIQPANKQTRSSYFLEAVRF